MQTKVLLATVVFLFGVAIFFVFRSGFIDQSVTGSFYDHKSGEWSLSNEWWVVLIYKGTSILTGVLGVALFTVIGLSFSIKTLQPFRKPSVFVVLVMVVGPGLVVNAVFKDHWGRPRPRDTIAFGGQQEYQAPFVISEQGGKSFPCGHCSVGFAMAALGWFFRQKKYALFAAFGTSTIFGLLIGLARIVVGGHYLSDVLTSMLMIYAVTGILAAVIFRGRIQKNKSILKQSDRKSFLIPIAWISVGVATFLGVLSAFPVSKERTITLDAEILTSLSERTVRFQNTSNVTWSASEAKVGTDGVTVKLDARGFGFPWSDFELNWAFDPEKAGLIATVEKTRGYYHELRIDLDVVEGKSD